MFEHLIVIYLGGVVIGLVVMGDRWPVRLATALAWPLGLLTFVAVVSILTVAAAYLWPIPVLVTTAALAALWLAV
jgi:hypothetical protein